MNKTEKIDELADFLDKHIIEHEGTDSIQLATYLINLGYSRKKSRYLIHYYYKGVGKRLCDWARELDIPIYVLRERLRRGWPIEKTLTTPIKKHSNGGKKIRVIQRKENGDFVKLHESITAAAKSVGCITRSITLCCRGEFNTVCGYMWEFAD